LVKKNIERRLNIYYRFGKYGWRSHQISESGLNEIVNNDFGAYNKIVGGARLAR
jgi:hypothetical protein